MDAASRSHLEHHSGQRFSLGAIVRNKLGVGDRGYRLIKGIVLIFIVTVAIWILVSAVLALVGLGSPRHTWLGQS